MSDGAAAHAPLGRPTPPADGFRTFLVLWSTQTLSLFGTFVSQFAVNIWLTRDLYPRPEQKPQLALALTLAALASAGPLIFAMPLAGAFADRHDRRRILIVCDGAAALVTALLVGLLLVHALTLWSAAALLVVYSLASSFHAAAFDSSYALLVPQAQFGRANGLMQTSFALSQVMAPAIAATLIGLPALLGAGSGAFARLGALRDGVPFAFAADGLTFAIAGVAVAALRIPNPPRGAGARQSLWLDVREGVQWILQRRPFVWLLQVGALANFTFAPLLLLLPLLVHDRLAADRAHHHLSFEATLALVNTAMGLGGVTGGVIMSVWGGVRRRHVYAMVIAMVFLGFGAALAGATRSVWVMALSLFLCELPVPLLNAHSSILWQSLTPPHLLARVLASRRFIAQAAFPLGTMIAGWLAAGFEPWQIVTIAALLLTSYCLVQLCMPGFRTLEHRMRASAGLAPE